MIKLVLKVTSTLQTRNIKIALVHNLAILIYIASFRNVVIAILLSRLQWVLSLQGCLRNSLFRTCSLGQTSPVARVSDKWIFYYKECQSRNSCVSNPARDYKCIDGKPIEYGYKRVVCRHTTLMPAEKVGLEVIERK